MTDFNQSDLDLALQIQGRIISRKEIIKDCTAANDEDLAILTALRDQGLIPDKLVNERTGITSSWQGTTRWKYSDAVRSLQDKERNTGVAIESTSYTWVTRSPAKPKGDD